MQRRSSRPALRPSLSHPPLLSSLRPSGSLRRSKRSPFPVSTLTVVSLSLPRSLARLSTLDSSTSQLYFSSPSPPLLLPLPIPSTWTFLILPFLSFSHFLLFPIHLSHFHSSTPVDSSPSDHVALTNFLLHSDRPAETTSLVSHPSSLRPCKYPSPATCQTSISAIHSRLNKRITGRVAAQTT